MTDIGFRKFRLSNEFLAAYKERPVAWGPLGEITFRRSYSRKKEDGTQEEWWEVCRRCIEGMINIQKLHCRRMRLSWDNAKAQNTAQEAYERMFCFKWTPPGRGMWAMGTELVDWFGQNVCVNCCFVSSADVAVDPVYPFEFMMDSLLLGSGVGFDCEGAGHLQIYEPNDERILQFIVPDSREGWTESMVVLLTSYFKPNKNKIEFDYSQIRPQGTPIKRFGGIAPGPEPLRELHENIRKIICHHTGSKLGLTAIVDLMNVIGKCVVSGGIRRSSQICLGPVDNADFRFLKTPIDALPNWYKDNLSKEDFEYHEWAVGNHRWASNNSVTVKRGDDYTPFVDATILNGEPGYVWLDNARKYGRLADPPNNKDRRISGVNPCGEIFLESGETCNLAETYPANHDSVEDYVQTLKYAAMYSQTVALVPAETWGPTNAVIARNRRIGISQSGVQQAINKFGRSRYLAMCEAGYQAVRKWNETYSDWFGIPRSIKISTIKPSGSVSLLCGATPGIHHPHSEYYIRRIRFSEGDPLIDALVRAGYNTEPDKYSTQTTVVEFPVHERNFTCRKEDVSVWRQVSDAIDVQRYWADNSVSITVTFKPEEADQILPILQFCEDKLKSVSFLPLRDHGYVQAPYEEISREDYERMVKRLRPVDYSVAAMTDPEGDKFCSGDTCEFLPGASPTE